jgi:hypothetical protein
MWMTLGTNFAWVLFLLGWGILLIADSKHYAAELDSVEIGDEVTDSNV